MGLNRGGLLASAATAALAFMDPSICSISDGNDGGSGGGGGGALDDLLDDAGGDNNAGAGDGGGGDGGAGDGGGGDGGGGGDKAAVAEWMKEFSGDAPGAGELSNQEWLAKIGAKDRDDLVSRYRTLEKAHRESGKVKIPGDDAKPEEIKAFREAIGVPEKPEGYEIKLPDGLDPEKYEVDAKFLGPLRQVALENNVPAKAFEAFGAAFMQQQAETIANEQAASNQARDEKLKEWGAVAAAKKEEFRRGAEVLGLDKHAIQKIQTGFGVGETMELVAKIGHMAGEDFFASGNAQQRFGVSDLEGAQKALDAMVNDSETAKALRAGTDKALKDKYNRLVGAVAHFRELENKRS